jgi:hypothetical protein
MLMTTGPCLPPKLSDVNRVGPVLSVMTADLKRVFLSLVNVIGIRRR